MVQIKMNWDDGRMRRMLNEAGQKAANDGVRTIERAVEAVRCVEHGEHARVSKAKTRDGYALRVEGCCDDLVARA